MVNDQPQGWLTMNSFICLYFNEKRIKILYLTKGMVLYRVTIFIYYCYSLFDHHPVSNLIGHWLGKIYCHTSMPCNCFPGSMYFMMIQGIRKKKEPFRSGLWIGTPWIICQFQKVSNKFKSCYSCHTEIIRMCCYSHWRR